MRKFLGTLVIVLLIVALVGFARGWFRLSTEDQPAETHVELHIDKDKIREDTQKAAEKAREISGRSEARAEESLPEE